MSDQITEDYQEQVLDDLYDIKESVTTDSGYEEKVLDDLHDIKESVSEEQDYYDKEYQKKVLGNLRSIQKSVEALSNDNIVVPELYSSFRKGNLYFDIFGNDRIIFKTQSGLSSYYLVYDVSNITAIHWTTSDTNTSWNRYCLSDVSPDNFIEATANTTFYAYSFTNNIPNDIDIKIENPDLHNYLYLMNSGSFNNSVYYYQSDYVDDSSGDSNVTSGSAVMVDGIDTLIQISTFQGFSSALLTGILLFLLFVKGLRR